MDLAIFSERRNKLHGTLHVNSTGMCTRAVDKKKKDIDWMDNGAYYCIPPTQEKVILAPTGSTIQCILFCLSNMY